MQKQQNQTIDEDHLNSFQQSLLYFLCQDLNQCKLSSCNYLHPRCFTGLCIKGLQQGVIKCSNSDCQLKHINYQQLKVELNVIKPINGIYRFNLCSLKNCQNKEKCQFIHVSWAEGLCPAYLNGECENKENHENLQHIEWEEVKKQVHRNLSVNDVNPENLCLMQNCDCDKHQPCMNDTCLLFFKGICPNLNCIKQHIFWEDYKLVLDGQIAIQFNFRPKILAKFKKFKCESEIDIFSLKEFSAQIYKSASDTGNSILQVENEQVKDQIYKDNVKFYIFKIKDSQENKVLITKLPKILVDTYLSIGNVSSAIINQAEEFVKDKYFTQCLAMKMAQIYREKTLSITEAPPVIYGQPIFYELETPFMGIKILYAEPYIDLQEIEWRKYTDNSLFSDPTFYYYTSFSHFTYVQSRGKFVITDLQGKLHFMSDPTIHTLDKVLMENDDNQGERGLNKFIKEQHRLCSVVCEKLDIKQFGCQINLIRWNYKIILNESRVYHQKKFLSKLTQMKNFFLQSKYLSEDKLHILLLESGSLADYSLGEFQSDNWELFNKIVLFDEQFLESQNSDLLQQMNENLQQLSQFIVEQWQKQSKIDFLKFLIKCDYCGQIWQVDELYYRYICGKVIYCNCIYPELPPFKWVFKFNQMNEIKELICINFGQKKVSETQNSQIKPLSQEEIRYSYPRGCGREIITKKQLVSSSLLKDFSTIHQSVQFSKQGLKNYQDRASNQTRTIVLLGNTGSGKRSLYNRITQSSETVKAGGLSVTQNIIKNKLFYYSDQFAVIDTPGFGIRYNKIQHVAGIIAALMSGSINRIMIVVKLERIDIMVMIVQNFFGALSRYNSLVTLVITHWDLVEKADEEETMNKIKSQFKRLKINSFIFTSNQEEYYKTIDKIVNQVENTYPQIIELKPIEIFKNFDLAEFDDQLIDAINQIKEEICIKIRRILTPMKQFVYNCLSDSIDFLENIQSLHLKLKNLAEQCRKEFESSFWKQQNVYLENEINIYLVQLELNKELQIEIDNFLSQIYNKILSNEHLFIKTIGICPFCGQIWLIESNCWDIQCGQPLGCGRLFGKSDLLPLEKEHIYELFDLGILLISDESNQFKGSQRKLNEILTEATLKQKYLLRKIECINLIKGDALNNQSAKYCEMEIQKSRKKHENVFMEKISLLQDFIFNLPISQIEKVTHVLVTESKRIAETCLEAFEDENWNFFDKLYDCNDVIPLAHHESFKKKIKFELQKISEFIVLQLNNSYSTFFEFLKQCPFCDQIWLKVEACNSCPLYCGSVPTKIQEDFLKADSSFYHIYLKDGQYFIYSEQREKNQLPEWQRKQIKNSFKQTETLISESCSKQLQFGYLGCKRKLYWHDMKPLSHQFLKESVDEQIFNYCLRQDQLVEEQYMSKQQGCIFEKQN